MKTLYVGNLPFSSTETELRELFGLYGEVRNVNIVLDRQTGRPRGFAFVSLDDEPADKALAALNGQLFAGRRLQISEARPLAERSGEGPRSADRRDRTAGDRPFRPRSGFDETRSGDRPFRPRPDFDETRSGDRPFRPRPGFHDGKPGDRPPFRPRPNFHDSRPAGEDHYHFDEEEDMGGEESAPPAYEERRPRTPHRSFNNRKSYRSRKDRDSDDGFRRPRRPPFRGGRRQDRNDGFSADDDED